MNKVKMNLSISESCKEKLKEYQKTNAKVFANVSAIIEYLVDNLDNLCNDEPRIFKQKNELITRLTTRCELNEQQLAALKEIHAREIESWKQRCELLQLQNEKLANVQIEVDLQKQLSHMEKEYMESRSEIKKESYVTQGLLTILLANLNGINKFVKPEDSEFYQAANSFYDED